MLSPFVPWSADECIRTFESQGKKTHQGVAPQKTALHPGITWSNSTSALGLQSLAVECRIRSRCTGKERDSESGLDNFTERYFGSSLGRFMTPDPVGGHLEDPQTLNKYAYVRNNPLTLTDPTGLDFYLQCTDEKHAGCTQVKINDTQQWVQADKNGNATIITSDSIRAGDNTATVNENGVQINGKSEGIYFDNPASKDANGDRNPITLQGSGDLKDFEFNVNGSDPKHGNFASGTFDYKPGINPLGGLDQVLAGRGSWTYGGIENFLSLIGRHPTHNGYFNARFGGGALPTFFNGGPSLHLTIQLEPKAAIPQRGLSTGDWHVDSATGPAHSKCASAAGCGGQ